MIRHVCFLTEKIFFSFLELNKKRNFMKAEFETLCPMRLGHV